MQQEPQRRRAQQEPQQRRQPANPQQDDPSAGHPLIDELSALYAPASDEAQQHTGDPVLVAQGPDAKPQDSEEAKREQAQREKEQMEKDKALLEKFFQQELDKVAAKERLTTDVIWSVYNDCKNFLKKEGRDDLLDQLNIIWSEFDKRFKAKQKEMAGDLQATLEKYAAGQHTATTETPPPPPGGKPPRGGEPPDDDGSIENEDTHLLADIAEYKRTIVELLPRIKGLQGHIDFMRPEFVTYAVRAVHVLLEDVKAVITYMDSAQRIIQNVNSVVAKRMYIQLVGYMTGTIDRQLVQLEFLMRTDTQTRPPEKVITQNPVDVPLMEPQERVRISRGRWEKLNDTINGQSERFAALRDHSHADVKISLAELVDILMPRIYLALANIVETERAGIQRDPARYDQILKTIEEDLLKAEGIFASLPRNFVRQRVQPVEQKPVAPQPRPPATRIESRPAPPGEKKRYEYVKNPPRGQQLDRRTGLPIQQKPSFFERIKNFFF